MSTRGRESVLAYLRRQGGDLLSADGRGITHRMAAALGYKLGSLGRVLAELEHDGLIEREIRGKRTYRITLRENVDAPVRTRAALPTRVDVGREPDPFNHGPMEEVLNLLIEIGVLERNFEQTIQRIEELRADVVSLMARCQQGVAEPAMAAEETTPPA